VQDLLLRQLGHRPLRPAKRRLQNRVQWHLGDNVMISYIYYLLCLFFPVLCN
jgi:hypothetical protein